MKEFAEEINKILTGEKNLSYSLLSKLLQSPKHFKAAISEEVEQTKAMKEGIMFHQACLEPEKFKENYWILEDSDICKEIGGAKPRATTKYKEWLEKEIANHSGEMISNDLYETMLSMSDALRLNVASGKLINNKLSTEEKFTIDYDGFNIAYKVDLIGENENEKFIVDLKKVSDASYKKIRWNITDMNYDMQGGMYSNFLGINNYYLIFIDAGCNITVVKLTKETLEAGFAKFEGAVEAFCKCAQENRFNESYEFWNTGYINF